MKEIELIQVVNEVPMINTKALAEVFERPHADVLKSMRGLIDEGFIGQGEFSASSYVNLQNKNQPCYALTEKAALIAMPFIGGKKSKEGQVRLVNEFFEYRTKAEQVVTKQPETKLEWMREAIAAEEGRVLAIEAQKVAETKIKEDAPKVEFYDAVVADSTVYDLAETAKLLNTGRGRLISALKEEGMLFQQGKPQPIQRYIDNEVFVYKLMSTFTDRHTGVPHDSYKTHVTSKGLDFIRKRL